MNTKIFDFMIFFHIHKICVFIRTTVGNRHENHKGFGISDFSHIYKCVCVCVGFTLDLSVFLIFFHTKMCVFFHSINMAILYKNMYILYIFCKKKSLKRGYFRWEWRFFSKQKGNFFSIVL